MLSASVLSRGPAAAAISNDWALRAHAPHVLTLDVEEEEEDKGPPDYW